MTTEMKFDPLGFASEGQIKNAEKLLKQKDSAGEPKVRRAKFEDIHPDEHGNYGTYHKDGNYFEDTWIVQGSKPYVVITADLGFECHILDQDGTRLRDMCQTVRNKEKERRQKSVSTFVQVFCLRDSNEM